MGELLRDPEFWVGIGTLIFLGILVWKKVPALIAHALDARAAAIAKELEDARRLREEAEALLAQMRGAACGGRRRRMTRARTSRGARSARPSCARPRTAPFSMPSRCRNRLA